MQCARRAFSRERPNTGNSRDASIDIMDIVTRISINVNPRLFIWLDNPYPASTVSWLIDKYNGKNVLRQQLPQENSFLRAEMPTPNT
jgi:hypothetical protein